MGYWVLAIGDWQLNMGGKAAIRAFTLYTLRFTLLAPATLPLTSGLIASSFAKGSVVTQMPSADAVSATSSAGQNLRRVRRALHFDHREISSLDRSEGHCKIVVVSSSMLR